MKCGSDTKKQSERSPSLPWKPPPVVVTLAEVPLICRLTTRPPPSPRPFRLRIAIDFNWPMGYAASTDEFETDPDQLWKGEATSPVSSTAGKVPPAVYPPVDDENSVRASAPDEKRRTSPGVAA